MTGQEDASEQAQDGGINRRTTLKGSAAALTAASLTSFASNAAAHHLPSHDGGGGGSDGGGSGVTGGANQYRFDGQSMVHMSASSENDQNSSDLKTLLRVDGVKKSHSWQDSLLLQPSIESSLVTDIGLTGDYDRSRAAAGVLGWIEVRESDGGDWQMVTVDDQLVAPPDETEINEKGEFDAGTSRVAELVRGVIAFNSRDFEGAWDLTEITDAIEKLDEDDDILDTDWSELYLDLYIKTRSANTFNFVKTNLPGTHDVRLRGALHVFVDDDDNEDVNAIAEVGSRTLQVEPRKIKDGVNNN